MKKILIVDDEMISLMMTENILASNYEAYIASSGKEAIDVYSAERPDMVLSDLRMPGMSGFDLKHTLEDHFHEVVPFMFMTADHDEETESKGFESGATDFIRKPFRADVLLRRIDNILQSVEKIQTLGLAATTDPMTGLLNKATAQKQIGEACQTATGIFMMVDLDSFKPVNDIYGHSMGDKILIKFSEILKSAFRSSDLIGRFGGDEFIVFCQNAGDPGVVAEKSERINMQIVRAAKEMMGEDMSIPLGASIGCALSPEDGTDFQTLYKKADRALYNVKQNGKHGHAFFNELKNTDQDEQQQATTLPNVLKILNERNISQGAFSLGMEKFRAVFQFLRRVHLGRQPDIQILLFTLSEAEGGSGVSHSMDAAGEHFMSILGSSLRNSDVITQNSRNQFIALLMDVAQDKAEAVVKHILEDWGETGESAGYALSYELGSIAGEEGGGSPGAGGRDPQ